MYIYIIFSFTNLIIHISHEYIIVFGNVSSKVEGCDI